MMVVQNAPRQTRDVVVQCACAAFNAIYLCYFCCFVAAVFRFCVGFFLPVTFTKKGVPVYFVVSLCEKYLPRDLHHFVYDCPEEKEISFGLCFLVLCWKCWCGFMLQDVCIYKHNKKCGLYL